MTLKARIQEDMKSAMRAGEKEKLGYIRMVMAAIKQREVDERIELDDTQVLSVIDKMMKQRRESIVQYEKGARADKERASQCVLEFHRVLQRQGAMRECVSLHNHSTRNVAHDQRSFLRAASSCG